MRLRTISETKRMLLKEDPESAMSEFLIRKLVESEKIRSIKTGTKVLVDYDSLLAWLYGKEYELPMCQIIVR